MDHHWIPAFSRHQVKMALQPINVILKVQLGWRWFVFPHPQSQKESWSTGHPFYANTSSHTDHGSHFSLTVAMSAIPAVHVHETLFSTHFHNDWWFISELLALVKEGIFGATWVTSGHHLIAKVMVTKKMHSEFPPIWDEYFHGLTVYTMCNKHASVSNTWTHLVTLIIMVQDFWECLSKYILSWHSFPSIWDDEHSCCYLKMLKARKMFYWHDMNWYDTVSTFHFLAEFRYIEIKLLLSCTCV